MSTTRKFKVWYSSDYRDGVQLHEAEFLDGEYEDHPPLSEEDIYNIEFQVEDEKNLVFYFEILYDNELDLILLKKFDNLSDAVLYSKQQYYHITKDFPFITTGMTSAYNPTGNRDSVSLENSKRNIGELDSNSYVFIIIINDTHFEGHSLGNFDIW